MSNSRTTRLLAAAVVFVAGCHHGGNGNAPPSTQAQPASSSTPAVQDVAQLIQDRFPGVEVEPLQGGGYTFIIRGRGTLMGGGDPLVLVDGTPVSGSLSWINPNDIARIEVLKNPDQTAIYGLRGANGVIVIWTKGSH